MNFRSPTLQLRRTLIVLPPIEIPEPTPLEMEEVLQSYAPSLPRSSVKPSAISAIVQTIPAKQPLTAPVPPVVIPPLPQLPPESYYPKTPPVPPPIVPVKVPVPIASLRAKTLGRQGRKVCRAYWAMVPWDSVIDGRKVATISWLYRLMFLRNRKKPEAGKLFPIRLTTCSVITKPKAPVYKTAPPSNVAAQIYNNQHTIEIAFEPAGPFPFDWEIYLNNVLVFSGNTSFSSYIGVSFGGMAFSTSMNLSTVANESLWKKTGNVVRARMYNTSPHRLGVVNVFGGIKLPSGTLSMLIFNTNVTVEGWPSPTSTEIDYTTPVLNI